MLKNRFVSLATARWNTELTAGAALRRFFSYKCLRMVLMAPFSNRLTCACEMPISEDTSSQLTAFNSIASSALTDICAVLDAEVPSTSTLQTDLLGESDLTDAFTQEGAADTLRGLAYGQAAAIQYTGYAIMLAVRLDPLSVSSLDALRSQILSDMKGEELNDALAAYGAQLDSTLSSSAMGKLPASKIVNATSANS